MLLQSRDKRKAVFIVTSFWANGELQIALEFAKRYEREIEPIFFIPKLHTKILKATAYRYFNLVANSPAINRLLFQTIEQDIAPDLIILADFLNYRFCHRHYGLTEGDLDIFSGKVCAFDIYDYQNSSKHVDAYGYVAKHMSELSLNRYSLLIQPVPICWPVIADSPNVFRYGLVSQPKIIIGAKAKRHKWQILVIGANWQFAGGHPDSTSGPQEWLKTGLIDFMLRMDNKATFLCLGYDITQGKAKPPNYESIASLPSNEFEDLIQNVDCVIGFNSISTSLAKIALKGVPVINISNHYIRKNERVFDVKIKKEVADIGFPKEHFYPFKLFPVGWHSFISHLDKNQYYELIEDVQLFAMQELDQIVERAILNTNQHRQKVAAYIDQVQVLDSHYDAQFLFQ